MYIPTPVKELQNGLQVRLYSKEKRNHSLSLYKQYQTSHEEILDEAQEICDALNNSSADKEGIAIRNEHIARLEKLLTSQKEQLENIKFKNFRWIMTGLSGGLILAIVLFKIFGL